MKQGTETRANYRKRGKARKVIWGIIALLLVSAIGVCGYEYANVRHAANKSYKSAGLTKDENGAKNSIIKNKEPISILLTGTDTGALGRSYKGRTDSIMVVVVNPKTKTTTAVSFERDFQVNLPDYPNNSPSKLNAAYTYGGISELAKVLKNYFKIPINAYGMINMGGMKSIIDKIGGIDITPTLSFNYEGYTFTKGVTTHMDGAKALAYSRMRYDDPQGDYGRQARQRQLLGAIIKSSTDISTLLNSDFISSLSNQVQTDLTFDDLTSMGLNYRKAGDNVVSDYTHGTGFYQDGVSYQSISRDERQRISNVIRQAMGMNTVTVE